MVNNSSKWHDVRSRFPGAEMGPYLDVSARSLLLEDGRVALHAHLMDLSDGLVDKPALFETVEQARRLFAALIRCDADEIAFTRNVTDGIAAFGASIKWREGDSVILCEDLEHPANVYPWYGLAQKFGLRIKNVASAAGQLPLDSIVDAIEPSTRVVAISAVSFAPGFCFPVPELGAECRRRDVLLFVDAAQSIGIDDIDVTKWQADAVAVSTQKGLMALYGLGFLYVRREVAENLVPVYMSRFGVRLDGHEAYAGNPASSTLAVGARRFDVGNYNYPAIITVVPSIQLLLDLGPSVVQARVRDLAHIFARRMDKIGLPIFGGPPGSHSGHIVSVGFSLGRNHDTADDPHMSSLHRHLSEGGAHLSVRRNLLRFSFHLYNNEHDIDSVVDLSADWIKKTGFLSPVLN